MIKDLLDRPIEKRPTTLRFDGRILFLVDDTELVRAQLFEGRDLELTDRLKARLRDQISTDEITPAYVLASNRITPWTASDPTPKRAAMTARIAAPPKAPTGRKNFRKPTIWRVCGELCKWPWSRFPQTPATRDRGSPGSRRHV